VNRRRFLFLSLAGAGQLVCGASSACPETVIKKAQILMRFSTTWKNGSG
jgi:hypothetical protein